MIGAFGPTSPDRTGCLRRRERGKHSGWASRRRGTCVQTWATTFVVPWTKPMRPLTAIFGERQALAEQPGDQDTSCGHTHRCWLTVRRCRVDSMAELSHPPTWRAWKSSKGAGQYGRGRTPERTETTVREMLVDSGRSASWSRATSTAHGIGNRQARLLCGYSRCQ